VSNQSLTYAIVITLGRIFTNSEVVEAYRFVFITFHRLLQNRFGINLKWRHIDRNGTQVAIVGDQDPKQMAGKERTTTDLLLVQTNFE
jgi:hypothetical protein